LNSQPPQITHHIDRQSLLLVFLCTLSGAAAQVFIKLGADKMTHFSLLQMLRNINLLIGYSMYGVNTFMLALALRKAPLSVLYPVISLTYVWVTILSVLIFKESVNGFKMSGLAAVIAGVAVLGLDGRK
jgi:multidrug transporter EmrE-like cation transporter